MNTLIPSLVATHKQRFAAGSERRAKRLNAWQGIAANAIAYFEAVKSEWESGGAFENIYVVDSTKSEDSKGLPPFVTIFFGNHPVGYTTFEQPKKLAVEGGCTLTISQDVFGHVACVFYPFKSELAKMPEDYLVAAIYYDPWQVTDSELDKLARKFLAYAQASSVYGHPRTVDKVRLFSMRLHHWWLSFKVKEFLGELFKQAAAASIKALAKHGT
jgi:hypothetical protein